MQQIPKEIMDAIVNDDLVGLRDYFSTHNNTINCRDNVGYTPLMYAVSFGRTDMINYLIEQKANPFSLCRYNDSPLSIAIRNLDEDTIKKLLNSYIKKLSDAGVKYENLEVLKSHMEDCLENLLLYIHSATESAQLPECFKSVNPKLILECHKEARDACEYLGIEAW